MFFFLANEYCLWRKRCVCPWRSTTIFLKEMNKLLKAAAIDFYRDEHIKICCPTSIPSSQKSSCRDNVRPSSGHQGKSLLDKRFKLSYNKDRKSYLVILSSPFTREEKGVSVNWLLFHAQKTRPVDTAVGRIFA